MSARRQQTVPAMATKQSCCSVRDHGRTTILQVLTFVSPVWEKAPRQNPFIAHFDPVAALASSWTMGQRNKKPGRQGESATVGLKSNIRSVSEADKLEVSWGFAELLDNFVRTSDHRVGDGDAERFRCLEINHQLDLGDLLDRQIGRLFALKDAASVDA